MSAVSLTPFKECFMKNALKIFGIIAIVAIIGLTMVGCSSLISVKVTEVDPSSNPFLGRWSGTDYEGEKTVFVFDATNVTLSLPDRGAAATNSTTYTYSGNVATFQGPGFTATATISDDAMTVLAGENPFATLSKQ
jgi:hypothetical protein